MSPVHYEGLQLEVDGHTAVLTLSNPPANTWTVQSLRALTQVVTDLNAAQDIYTLIVTGQGREVLLGRCRPQTVCTGRPGHGPRHRSQKPPQYR